MTNGAMCSYKILSIIYILPFKSCLLIARPCKFDEKLTTSKASTGAQLLRAGSAVHSTLILSSILRSLDHSFPEPQRGSADNCQRSKLRISTLMASLTGGAFEKSLRFVARDTFAMKVVPLILPFTSNLILGHISMIWWSRGL